MDEEIVSDDTGAALLRLMEDGLFINVLGSELRAAIASLCQTADRTCRRARGSVTIKIDLEHDGHSVLESEGMITVKLPKLKRKSSVHFTDAEGDILNRRPEKQLELKEVPAKVETVGPKAKEPKAPAAKAM